VGWDGWGMEVGGRGCGGEGDGGGGGEGVGREAAKELGEERGEKKHTQCDDGARRDVYASTRTDIYNLTNVEKSIRDDEKRPRTEPS